MKESLVSAERVREILHYCPETGVFTRRVAHRNGFFKVGDVAGSVMKTKGYVRISIGNVSYQAHRLAWLYMTGEWPTGQIDHIDSVRSNNRWNNLRDVSASTNKQNLRRAQSNNSTGLLGVTFNRACGKFQASIFVDKKLKHLGLFDEAQAAHEAYLAAKRELHEGNTL